MARMKWAVLSVLALSWGWGWACRTHDVDPTRVPPAMADLAIESVSVIDAVSGTRANQRVVLRGDRIVWVGPMDASDTGASGPPASRTIDGQDRFLIPGLWDAHVHFLYDPDLTSSMAELFLAYGITSVRDTGGDAKELAAIRAGWQRAGVVHAPRLFFSGPLLDGEPVVYDGAEPEQPALGTSVASVEIAREKVAWLDALGADFIKIYELVTPEVFEALVAEARRRGLPIAAHIPLSMTADVAGPKVDSMEHLRNVELACATNWRELHAERLTRIAHYSGARGFDLRKSLHTLQRLPAIAQVDHERCTEVVASLVSTMQVPTLRLNAFNRSLPFQSPEWNAGLRRLPDAVRERWNAKVIERQTDGSLEDQRFAEWSLFLVGLMNAQGVPIAAGTDTPIGLAVPGESLHRELELLVESGLSTGEALAAATIEPARFFGLEGEMGQVAVGMRGDLVLLSGNPLLAIRNTRRIEAVIAQGRLIESRPN